MEQKYNIKQNKEVGDATRKWLNPNKETLTTGEVTILIEEFAVQPTYHPEINKNTYKCTSMATCGNGGVKDRKTQVFDIGVK